MRVRMGLHTGEPLVEGNHYVGVAVHRASACRSAAHGGQILVSNSTRELIADELPSGVVVLRDLGLQQLKDLDRPEHVFQLEAEGLQRAFPPIRGKPPAPTGLRRLVPRTRWARAAAAVAALALVAAILAGVLLTGGDGEPLALGSEDALAAVDPGSGKVEDQVRRRRNSIRRGGGRGCGLGAELRRPDDLAHRPVRAASASRSRPARRHSTSPPGPARSGSGPGRSSPPCKRRARL